ncbi:MAG TPA: DnaB-like helicase C-terminal domain-containing protein [Bacteroidales bacterium]|nr:DnaB-like helicase C-terminal domain-containing protein [Bacteroidales bacterium]
MELNMEFRVLILKALVSDFNFCRRFIDVLQIDYFDMAHEKIIFKHIKSYFTTYKKLPIIEEFMQIANADIKNDSLLEKVIKMIYRNKSINLDYISEELKNFCVHQALKNTIIDAHNNLLPQLKFDTILENIKRTIQFKDTFEDSGINYLSSLDDRLLMQRKNEEDTFHIPTGIHSLDCVIKGLTPKQVGVIIAPPKMGKSMFLIQAAQNALYYRKNVIYYTFELSEEDVCRRFDSCISGIPMDNLDTAEEALRKRLDFIKNTFKTNLVVKFFPTRKATVNTLHSHIRQVESVNGFKPDLIIVDYATRMKPCIDRKDKRLEVDDIFQDLIGLAGELNVRIWTAHQSSREGINNEDLDMTHTSESLEPARGCDIILGMGSTQQQRQAGVCSINIMGSRNGVDGIKLYASRQAERMRIKSIDKDEYKELMKKHVAKIKMDTEEPKETKKEKQERLFRQK